MVSDTLSDAAHDIREYLRRMPDVYEGKTRDEIQTLLTHMDRVRVKLDTPPVLVRIGAAS